MFPVSFFRKQSKLRHFIKVAGLLSRFYKETDSDGNISCESSDFSKLLGDTVYNSVGNSTTCTGVFQKVVLLEISRNLQFATLLKLQPIFLNVQTEICNTVLSY